MAGAGCVVVLTITLVPLGAASPGRYVSFDAVGDLALQFNDFPSQTAVLQFAINVFLLSWLGVLLPLVSSRIGVIAATVACTGAAILIETLQYVLDTGRSATLADLILNAAGGLIGAVVSVHLLRPRLLGWLAQGRRPTPHQPEAAQA